MRTLQEEAVRLVEDDVTTIAEVLRSIYVRRGSDDAEVRLRRATTPDGAARSRAPSRAASRGRRRARAVRAASCATSGSPRSRASSSSRSPTPRVKRERGHAPLPPAGARSSGPASRSSTRCTSLGEEAHNSVGAPDADRDRGRPARRRARSPTASTGTRRSSPTFYRGILRSAELTGQLDTVLDQLADLHRARPRGAAQDQGGADLPGDRSPCMSVVTVVDARRSSCCRSSRTSSRASTPSCRCRPGCCWRSPTSSATGGGRSSAGSRPSSLLGFLVAPDRRRQATLRDRAAAAGSRCIGETIQYALVERFCRILASMVSAGVHAAARRWRWRPSRCATGSSSGALGAGRATRCSRARASPGRWRGPGCSPATATQMIRVGEETGTLDTQLEVDRAATTRASSTTRSRS